MGAPCPACGFENLEGATQCARCHLSTSLFDAVQEAAGSPDSHPRYLQAIGEILAAVDAPPDADADATESSAVLSSPARFLSMPPPTPPKPSAEREPIAPTGFPALPPGGDVPVLKRQVNDYLQLARRQGLDLAEYGERARAAVLSDDRGSLEVLGRDLFVHLAASLTEEYENALARRHELSGLVATTSPDVELESCRASLSMGDLAGTQRRLRHIEQELSDLEDHWATVQILVTECELVATTITELGGDPTPALGPLGEGRRLAREGERELAEPVLARAALALWTVLDPMFLRELARIRDTVLRRRSEGLDTGTAVVHLRQLAADLRHRNFGAAIAAYRQLRSLAESAAVPPAPVAGVPAADADGSG